jgi:zinc and cadmium transporter
MSVFLLILSVCIGGFSIFLFKNFEGNKVKLFLSFSGSFLFALSILDLLPEVYQHSQYNIGVFILIGFFIQLLIDYFSEGIEHGHIHIHQHSEKNFPVLIMVGLCIHAFIEGLPLFLIPEKQLFNKFLGGIFIHNIPISFTLMTVMIGSGLGQKKSILNLLLFSVMTPLGAALGLYMQENGMFSVAQYEPILMSLVIGLFLHISTSILFESAENHKFHFSRFAMVILGFVIALVLL